MKNGEHKSATEDMHPAMDVEAAHQGHEEAAEIPHMSEEAMTTAATVGVVAVGAALWEVALIPGIVLGVAAMLAPKYVPKMGEALAPMFRSSVRGAYKLSQKTREMVAEAKEHVNDIVAEVHAESDAPAAAPKIEATHS